MTASLSAVRAAAAALILGSCAAPPKAIVVAEQPPPTAGGPQNKDKTATSSAPSEPDLPVESAEDNIRLPEMLGLPGESDFRSTSPSGPKPGGGAVITRPPTDPPSRPKPKVDN